MSRILKQLSLSKFILHRFVGVDVPEHMLRNAIKDWELQGKPRKKSND